MGKFKKALRDFRTYNFSKKVEIPLYNELVAFKIIYRSWKILEKCPGKPGILEAHICLPSKNVLEKGLKTSWKCPGKPGIWGQK